MRNIRLTLEEQIELGKRISRGDKEAEDMLFTTSLNLVIVIAKKYYNPNSGMEFEDLVQEGNIGLYKAVKKYDYRMGFRFSTYATFWINQSIQKGIARNNNVIRFTEHALVFIKKMSVLSNEYIKKNSVEPSNEYLAKKLNCSVNKIVEIKRAMQLTISIDKEYNSSDIFNEDKNSALINSIPTNEEEIENKIIQHQIYEILNNAINNLSDKEKQIITWKYGLDGNKPKSLQDISNYYGITRERVRQISLRAETKIKEILENEGLSLSDFINK